VTALIRPEFPGEEQVQYMRGVANALAYHRAERDLVGAGVGAARQRLAVLGIEAEIGDLLARLGELEHIFRHHLRQQGRLVVTRRAIEAEFDFTVPPRRQSRAKFGRVARRATNRLPVIERSVAVMLDL
jgi:hypothetical protein